MLVMKLIVQGEGGGRWWWRWYLEVVAEMVVEVIDDVSGVGGGERG